MSGQRPADTGGLRVSGARIALVAARFNGDIVDRLVDGARETLQRHGIGENQIEVTRVPGAWELPLAAAHLADQGRFDAIVALGAVIRGDTPHFEHVCSGCTSGLMQVQQEYGIPVAFGVLTCDTGEQARARSAKGAGNKGAEAALAALEMTAVLQRIDG